MERCLPLESWGGVEGAEGQDLLLTSLAVSQAEEERWQIYQHLQWEEARGISVEVVKAHAVMRVRVLAPLGLRCEPFVTEAEVEEHPVDYQSYFQWSEG